MSFVPSSQILTPPSACFEVDPTGATQALFGNNEHVPVFQLPRASVCRLPAPQRERGRG